MSLFCPKCNKELVREFFADKVVFRCKNCVPNRAYTVDMLRAFDEGKNMTLSMFDRLEKK